jgi:hypothetical protein
VQGLRLLWSFCVFQCVSVVLEVSICVRDCRGLGLCKVGILGWSVGDECEQGRGSLVSRWGRMRGIGEGGGREWVRRSRTSFWRWEQWILAQEKE